MMVMMMIISRRRGSRRETTGRQGIHLDNVVTGTDLPGHISAFLPSWTGAVHSELSRHSALIREYWGFGLTNLSEAQVLWIEG